MTAAKINLKFMDQVSYLEGFHRSGWPFVLRNLLTLQNDDGVWCDTYVDRTFHWYKPNFIPYQRPWIGFIHHTFNTEYSIYNNVNLLENEAFLQSLPQCKGLFVFTQALQTRWQQELSDKGYDVKVKSLFHPTQFVDTVFTMEQFYTNTKPYLVQIGAWLRDNYSIYRLNCGQPDVGQENKYVIRKAALRGYNMDHYFKPLHFFRSFRKPSWKEDTVIPPLLASADTDVPPSDTSTVRIISPNGELPADVHVPFTEDDDDDAMCRDIMCRDILCRDSEYALNKYVIGAIHLLEDYDSSVILIPYLGDSDYDGLLRQNIVYMQLVDAGAVNTIIECIVRNTPIVVNKIPPVVEYLGADYPLYFDASTDDISILNPTRIQESYDYLNNMDKSFLTIQSFMNSFTSSDIYKSL